MRRVRRPHRLTLGHWRAPGRPRLDPEGPSIPARRSRIAWPPSAHRSPRCLRDTDLARQLGRGTKARGSLPLGIPPARTRGQDRHDAGVVVFLHPFELLRRTEPVERAARPTVSGPPFPPGRPPSPADSIAPPTTLSSRARQTRDERSVTTSCPAARPCPDHSAATTRDAKRTVSMQAEIGDHEATRSARQHYFQPPALHLNDQRSAKTGPRPSLRSQGWLQCRFPVAPERWPACVTGSGPSPCCPPAASSARGNHGSTE
jgi:hypothetical protein